MKIKDALKKYRGIKLKTRLNFKYCNLCVNEDVCTPANECIESSTQIHDVPIKTAMRERSISVEKFLKLAKKEHKT